MVLERFFEIIFGWAVAMSPLLGIILISFVLSMISTLSWKYLTDQILLKSIKEKTQSMKEEFKKHKSDPNKLTELNAKFAKENWDAMKTQYKQSIKPMIVTMIPFFLVFAWVTKTYKPLGDIFLGMGGIGTYILFSVIFSMILRKVMKVY